VDDAASETNEERALWNTFLVVKNKIHSDIFSVCIEVDDFIELSSELVQPFEDFYDGSLCDGGMLSPCLTRFLIIYGSLV
ncbi:hypothetical protein QUC31_010226, partial [Theobroma cacao]